ncbi:MAG: GNAT family N-acetyltransferase [Saprospiraceae bacterium]
MSFSIFYQQPDAAFWERYARLWQNSQHRSPFQSPSILRYYAEQNVGKVAVFQCERDNELLGAALFKRDDNHYSFLSDLKTDANFFIIHRECDSADMRQFFENLLESIQRENWALMLNHKPAWAGYMDILESVIRKSPMYAMSLDYSVCPIVEAESPEALFKEVSASRNTRYKLNKFVKQENGSFEVLTDGADLDQWAEDFCTAHMLRWAPTPTPSAYRDPARRQFLRNCLHAWQADGVLVRFALRTDKGRVGLMVGLLEDNTLIYHTPTFHPDCAHVSPGRVLVYYITSWMSENGLSRLDFGDGNEPYKYYVASKDQVLRRIFLSRKSNLQFILKTRFIKVVRENQAIFQLYQNKIKPMYRNLKWKVSAMFSTTFCLNCLEFFSSDEQQLLCVFGY